MNYLHAENISKSYGDKVLFSSISLLINKGDKIALIAKNGSGKSTLLRVLAGMEQPEGEMAKIIFKQDIRTIFLEQEPVFQPGMTIGDAIFDAEDPKIIAIKAYESALASSDDERTRVAMARLDDLQAWDMEVRISETLQKLRIAGMDRKVSELSGGQKKRLALAKVLVQEPDFIILDEPTNHLDLDMIEWLESYLQQANLTVFMVTHDRYFLENVCNRILELEDGNLYPYAGNYEQYLEKKIARVQNDNVVAEKNKKLLKKEWEWLGRQPQARGTKAKARVDKVWELKETVSQIKTTEEMSIQIEARRLGSKIVEFHDVGKSFEEIRILDHFFYKFRKKERVGIVGPNGAGKTSFINIMTGQLKPDYGRVIIGETVYFGYYTQEGIALSQDKRVVDVIRDIAEYLPLAKGFKLTAEQLLERFLFPRKQQQVFVSQLSGGEKRRLHLLTSLMRNPNFLILDEPTNDLDIITLNVLEEYLMGFDGCLVVITHDRYFMDKLVEHLFVMEGDGKIRDFNGNYTQYRESRGNVHTSAPKTEQQASRSVHVADTEEARKLKNKMKNELNRVERELEQLEEKKAALNNYFMQENLSVEEIEDKGKELQMIQEKISLLEQQWESLVEKM
ncbi:MAG TPA: ABC-F family ATP-binding cassette domain-containing protein [Saprospiraceae bacterium]|nr:ABC transporter [Saprospirales bacterium]HRQ29652.1 ABC-F family ATP-binding cassette domain-containing protein [Saprospiraceae bacterium]